MFLKYLLYFNVRYTYIVFFFTYVCLFVLMCAIVTRQLRPTYSVTKTTLA